jgi:hypothetical protein
MYISETLPNFLKEKAPLWNGEVRKNKRGPTSPRVSTQKPQTHKIGAKMYFYICIFIYMSLYMYRV